MTDYRQIMDELDACRPDRDSTNEPELARLAKQITSDADARSILERSQRLDRNIRRAMHAVPIPPGLNERLLNRLAGAGAIVPSEPTVECTVEPTVQLHKFDDTAQPASNRSHAGRMSRRRWLISAAVAASVAAATGVWVFKPAQNDPITPELLVERSQTWHDQLAKPGTAWSSDFADVRRDYDALRDRFQQSPTSWTDARPVTGLSGTAFRFDIGGSSATAFVLSAPAADAAAFPDFPQAEPISGTWGKAVSSWKSGESLIVLVMDDAQIYRQLVDRRIRDTA